MINTALIKDNKKNSVVGSIVNDLYYLPQWEIVKSFSFIEKKFLFFKKLFRVNILHKYSIKNKTDKYSLRTFECKTLANMDLMIYKDCVYIVNFEILSKDGGLYASEKLLGIAIEKAIYNTSDKYIYINITPEYNNKKLIKKFLLNNGFNRVENQTKYEKKILGEMYKLEAGEHSIFDFELRHLNMFYPLSKISEMSETEL